MYECFFEEQFYLYLQDLPSINFLLFFLFRIWSFKPSAFYFQMNNLQTYKTTYSFFARVLWNYYNIYSVKSLQNKVGLEHSHACQEKLMMQILFENRLPPGLHILLMGTVFLWTFRKKSLEIFYFKSYSFPIQ